MERPTAPVQEVVTERSEGPSVAFSGWADHLEEISERHPDQLVRSQPDADQACTQQDANRSSASVVQSTGGELVDEDP
jgi:hypothetical protein